MPKLSIIPLDPLRRPPLPGQKAEKFGDEIAVTACRNESVSALALIGAEPGTHVRVSYSGPGAATICRVREVWTQEMDRCETDALMPEAEFDAWMKERQAEVADLIGDQTPTEAAPGPESSEKSAAPAEKPAAAPDSGESQPPAEIGSEPL